MNRYTFGVDLGQVSDPTAFSILDERMSQARAQDPSDIAIGAPGRRLFSRTYQLRQLERPPLGTAYPEIVRNVKDLLSTPQLRDQTDLVVDATGVGRPVIDDMREKGLNPIPVIITFGNAGRDVIMGDDGYFRVPKVDVMSSLQVLFGSHRLEYPEVLNDKSGINLIPVWLTEMERFRMKITKSGNMTYEAWRETDHDDIVLSIAISCWWILYSRPKDEVYVSNSEPEEPYNPHDSIRRARIRR
jgi:hypothetical protein